MPRNHAPGPSTLRNRNRVTNKTRLRIIRGNIDADPLAFDEDEEKARVVSTAGVDAEDANEHHLQAVLSAATQRQSSHRATRGGIEKEKQDAYIPIPDSTGLVEDYDRWYAAERWKDPASYIKTSENVEEAISDSLANGFTYLMDERDKEWLDRNNEEARGEGTSAQGALSTPGTTTRLSQRSSKAKGKEPDLPVPVVISEDEFELVMGLFEKITHEKTEFLHHGLEQGAPFPPFSDYHDTFAAPLSPDTFTSFAVPAWISPPLALIRSAKAVYPYWKERRIERNGHRIIPVLNFDEADIRNESYICFRRRDVKTVRKTRASQASSSEKLIRLQKELLEAIEMAKTVHVREQAKRDVTLQAKEVWEKREGFVNLKRKFPQLSVKEEEELLYDKERVPKRPRLIETSAGRIGLRLTRTRESGDNGSPVAHAETTLRPKERAIKLQAQVDQEMAKLKDRDYHWEDAIDSSYQPRPAEFAARHFLYIPPSDKLSLSTPTEKDEQPRQWRAVRTRRGRGGVLRVDRRLVATRSSSSDDESFTLPRRSPRSSLDAEDADAQESARRIRERWKFDHDDEPPLAPEGVDEQDRALVDEFNTKYLLRSMTFFQDEDHQRLTTDPTLYLPIDGRTQGVVPYRLGMHPVLRRDAYASAVAARPHLSQAAAIQHAATQAQQANLGLTMPQTNGTPISMQAQLKKLPSTLAVPQLRISSNGGMRPPTTPTVAPIQLPPPPSPNHPATPSDGQFASPTPVNGVDHEPRTPSSASNTNTNPASDIPMPPASDPNAAPAPAAAPTTTATTVAAAPMPVKPPATHHAITMPNGYHMNAFNPALPNGGGFTYTAPQTSNLSAQALQNLRSVYNLPAQDLTLNASRAASYIGHVVPNGSSFNLPVSAPLAGGNINLKLPAPRQMQWAAAQNGTDGAAGVAIAHSLSPHMHSPAQQGSPPRTAQQPSASPSMHHQQAVGGSY
ncbi:hypothetical protein FA95DRAFT_1518958 [Auriscalpium vulgare]|uniref:Uncharacterized protein n=1 Tax=Auriscalpium vulgare TaxID=40419 RepID=A0ACB8RUB9_9AGAM|nr:hypothetical protein FA95DRAFT_1518958 [Auriscalpium vulgare]